MLNRCFSLLAHLMIFIVFIICKKNDLETVNYEENISKSLICVCGSKFFRVITLSKITKPAIKLSSLYKSWQEFRFLKLANWINYYHLEFLWNWKSYYYIFLLYFSQGLDGSTDVEVSNQIIGSGPNLINFLGTYLGA